MNRSFSLIATCFFLLLGVSPAAFSFCGFYVAKADAKLYNKASQVVLVRDENKTVISMSNDYEGDLNEFAMIVPVPVVLEKSQIHVGERALIDRVDAFSAPRLVEYFDPDPCQQIKMFENSMGVRQSMLMDRGGVSKDQAKSLGVTIEAQYTIGEYDIVILSAKESNGLETWLKSSGYRIPAGASAALRPYIKQNLKFFVAKVNLDQQVKTGLTYLRPIQIAFESEKFMLPIRLGMINAKDSQDLLIYVLTKTGRVESTNYRTINMPSNMDIPVFIKDDFGTFYKDMFGYQTKKKTTESYLQNMYGTWDGVIHALQIH
ncbi:MAG: DUF2330 domain-containing protein [Bdellovibrionota bacterium]